jgi:hypothetical protein
MLAVPAAPFDSPEYSFEVKWNSIRALAAVEMAGWRLWGRELADYTARYPELDVLRRLPAGTLVDGELVAFDADGRPDLPRLLRRHGLTDSWRIRQARHWCSVRYVLFDLLYHAGRCLLREPAGTTLVLHVLHYPEQVRVCPQTVWPLAKEPTEELGLAGMLIEAADGKVDWTAYPDQAAQELKTLIEAKLAGLAGGSRGSRRGIAAPGGAIAFAPFVVLPVRIDAR